MKALNTKFRPVLLLILIQLTMNYTYSIELTSEDSHSTKYSESCLYNKTLIEVYYDKRSTYEVDCHKNYHHYNARAYETYYKPVADKVRVSNFNIWHPGKSNTRFKDYKLIASIINRFDITAGLELLSSVGEEFSINEKVVKISRPVHVEIEKLKIELSKLTKLDEIKKMQKLIGSKRAYMRNLVKVYKKPGYLKILEELKKLDASWSLIIASEGEAAKASDVHELTGYFYRARAVRPIVNPYCKEKVNNLANPFACTVSYKNGLDRAFSRRPFMGSFIAGNFDFMILAAHVIFNSPSKPEEKEFILQNAFGVSKLSELEDRKGIDNTTYARFAEVKFTLDFMKDLEERFEEKDIIYAGDLNLENKNPFFKKIIDNSSYESFIDEATSLTERRVVNGNESNGIASNYDHFIFNPKYVSECDTSSATMFNFITDRYMKKRLEGQYVVRSGNSIKDILYETKSEAQEMMELKEEEFREKITNEKKILRGKIVQRYKSEEIEKLVYEFNNRVFGTQLSNYSYYRVFKELMSDHMPIKMNCSTL